ncbi:MAG: hypothetical protein HDQ44_03700 [Desulfovibrio sp.]|nr:hypothetical protein [Desulfovibrio sp.]
MWHCEALLMANELIDWLEKRHATIMDYEKVALTLMNAGDIDGYRKNMREKAESLANLAADAQPLLKNLANGPKIEAPLERFSDSAATALEIDSVFYMSALLYPDDYKEGEPDNLALFIAGLKKEQK